MMFQRIKVSIKIKGEGEGKTILDELFGSHFLLDYFDYLSIFYHLFWLLRIYLIFFFIVYALFSFLKDRLFLLRFYFLNCLFFHRMFVNIDAYVAVHAFSLQKLQADLSFIFVILFFEVHVAMVQTTNRTQLAFAFLVQNTNFLPFDERFSQLILSVSKITHEFPLAISTIRTHLCLVKCPFILFSYFLFLPSQIWIIQKIIVDKSALIIDGLMFSDGWCWLLIIDHFHRIDGVLFVDVFSGFFDVVVFEIQRFIGWLSAHVYIVNRQLQTKTKRVWMIYIYMSVSILI